MSTHNKHTLQATPCSKLADIGLKWREYDVVGIDEGQFFPDLHSFCETVANAGKVVVVAALDGTFQRKVGPIEVVVGGSWDAPTPSFDYESIQRFFFFFGGSLLTRWVRRGVPFRIDVVVMQPFGSVCDLVAVAEEVQKFSAVCHGCSENAAFSQRITADTAVEVIGGSDMYVPMCRPCFLKDPAATGSIHITMGPMFSGKSSDLLRRIRRMQHAKKRCLLVKYSRDDRYSEVRLAGRLAGWPLLSLPYHTRPLPADVYTHMRFAVAGGRAGSR